MRRSLRAAVAAGALGAGLAVALILAQSTSRAAGIHSTPNSAGATGTFTEFAVPTASSVPESIVTGPDGNLWFTESQAGGAIGRITPSGTVTEFSITTPNSGAFWITPGPDGNLWFTEGQANKIGKMSSAGAMLAEYAVPTLNSSPNNIVLGPDGNLWFTEFNGDAIGKITTAGVLTEVAHLTVGAGPTGMVAGSDGNLWFTEQKSNKIGRITTAGTLTEFALVTGRTPAEIAAGPDGNLWFTEFDGNRIGEITTAGAVTEFAVPTASSQPGSIAVGIDGNLWFTEQNGNKVARLTSDGTISEFGPIPTAASGPGGINPGPDGNLWFTERLGNNIGRLSLSCDTWLGTVDGNFGTAGNWSTGAVPTSADDVCITATTKTGPAAKFDTYTVLLNGNFTVHSLALGGPNGTQTLVIPASGVALNLNASSSIGANGVLTMGDAGTGTSALCCAGTTLTSAGHLNTVAGGGGTRFLRLNLTNAASGIVDIGGPTSQDGIGGATTTTNDATLILEKAQILALTGGSTFTQGFGGTLATTIDVTATTFGRLTANGALVSVDGLLKVTTVGSPLPGSPWPIISSASISGVFASLDFGPLNYTVQYSANAVTLYGLAPCDYWIGGNGNFNTPSNWSYGTVPTSADDVCIDRNTTSTPKAALDTYTVVVDSNVTVNTLTLGPRFGGATLQVAGNNSRFLLNNTSSINASGTLNVGDSNVANGYTWLGSGGGTPVLINAGRLNTVQGGGGTRYLRINLNNFTNGTIDIAANDTRQDNATTTTNNSNFTVEAGVTFAISNGGNFTNLQGVVTNNGTFSQTGGTFTARTGSEAGNPVFLKGGVLDDDLSAGPGQFIIANPTGTYTLTGTSTQPGVAAGQVVTLAGDNTVLDVGVSLTNAGTLNLGDAGIGWSWLRSTTGVVLTNTGHLNTVQGGGGIRYLRAFVTNAAGGTVDLAAANNSQDTPNAITNNGAFTVEAGASFAMSGGGSFFNLGGSITNLGTFSQNGSTFTQRGGTETGNPVLLQNGGLDDDVSAGAAKFTISNPGAPPYPLTGTGTQPGIAPGQLVTIPSNNSQVDIGVAFTNAGTLAFGDAGGVQNVLRAGNGGASLTNTGHLNVVQGGGGTRYLRIPITNAAGGTVDIAATDTRLDAAYTFTNNGTFTVEAGAAFAISGGGSFANLGGSITNLGSFSQNSNTFTQRNGTESGNPILLNGGNLDDDLGAGTAAFTIKCPSCPYETITGTGPNPGIASGQTVTVTSDNTRVVFGVNLTNAGTLNVGDAGTGWDWLCCNGAATLTNTGHLNAVLGGGGARYLRIDVNNAPGGTIDVAGAAVDDFPTHITNNGTLVLEPGGTLSLSAGATFTQGATGTFQTTIDANATKFGQLNGGGDAVTLDGKLRVITVGHPAVGSSWPIIANAVRSGTFASSDICTPDYNVEYASTGVTLTLRAIFYTTQSTIQEKLANSDGTTWVDMDPAPLSLTFTPPADSFAILSGNADLWTSAAGYNQDLGISVSGAGQSVYPTIAGQPEAWKESGGYAGTFSPNAAFVQTAVLLKQGQSYTVKLVWKANVKALGATIWAGAGPIGTKFSPTRLTAQLLPSSTSNLKGATITNQPTQSGSDGATWKDLDPGLSFQYTPCVNGMAVLSGNVDLWTSVRGFNQDVGISVSGGTAYPAKAGQPEAWKESGGFAGTFSPNAAFVQAVIPLNANTTYTIKLSWKANKQSTASAAIWAGAGPIGSQFSPTRLQLQFFPSTGGPAGVLDKVTTQQFGQVASDGATWQNLDALTQTVQSATACTAIISANADLWTDTPGYNQDIGILVLGGGFPTVPLQPEAWKESGGSAGTYSPNAAFVQMVLPMAANTPYTVTLQWKANRQSPAFAGIWTGAGPIGSDFSPTRLTVQFLGCT